MGFRVKIMPRAQRDLAALYREIGDSPAARAWYAGLREGIRSLRDNPRRCPIAPEDAKIRHWLYGNKPHVYRILYRILEKARQVDILHIRHGAMDAFDSTETGIPKRRTDQ